MSQTLTLAAAPRVRVQSWANSTLLGLVCGCLFFYGLDRGDLFRTENLRALIAQEMLTGGDWVVPRLGGEPMFSKPPGMYAAIALCSMPMGRVTEWSARLPSALAASASVFLFAWYFRRQLGRFAGLAAGILLPMTLLWLDKATSAEIDMLHMFCIIASILLFLRAIENHERLRFELCLAALLCVAGGFLTKWSAPEFFYGTIIPYLWQQRRLRVLLSWQHLLSAALAGAIALTWIALAVHRTDWATFSYTVGNESLRRFSPAHFVFPYPWHESLYHPFKILAAFLPMSLAVVWTLRPRFVRTCDARERRLLLAMHCWIWPQLLFWSLPSEHATRHSFPLYPGMVGLAVLALCKAPNPRAAQRFVVGLLIVWLGLKVLFVEVIMPRRIAQRDVRGKAAQIAAVVPAHAVLHYFHINKDEGILYYYGNAAQRHREDEIPPPANTPRYYWLAKDKWLSWNRDGEVLWEMLDELGKPAVLVRAK
jgi:4-amino-4-deoxy-L-arabinose transferase-like glycosyltransferase